MSRSLGLGALLVLASLACFVQLASASDDSPKDHYQLQVDCLDVLNEQISWELYASIVYLNMAGYFDRPSVALDGYAGFFKDQSLEEFGHASKIIDYINSRNGTVKRVSVDESPKNSWSSPREALRDAIKLEKHVYAKIQYIHDVAEQKCQDAHLTDFLESYYFIEQVESINELQRMLVKIDKGDPVLDFLTDERLRKARKDKAKKESKGEL